MVSAGSASLRVAISSWATAGSSVTVMDKALSFSRGAAMAAPDDITRLGRAALVMRGT